MRRGVLLLILAALIGAAGCHHDKYNLKANHPEEMRLPPDEPRYNNPPESEYKKRDPKKEFRPGPGAGGMNAPGRMGGQ